MKAQSYVKDGFIHASFVGKKEDLISWLDMLVKYDDGQGRNYDILDEEINNE